MQEDIFELGRNILQEVIEDIDDKLRSSGVRKKEWEVVRKDPGSILTSFGTLRYGKAYFKPKKGGSRKYLVDKIVGIDPHDRVSSDEWDSRKEVVQSDWDSLNSAINDVASRFKD